MIRISKQSGKILFVSDTHGSITDIDAACAIIRTHNIDALILGGDIPDHTIRNFKSILSRLHKLPLPVIIYPGSHETYRQYTTALKKYPSIIDARKNKRFQYGDSELLMIPGSDVLNNTKKFCGGSFLLQPNLYSKKKVKKFYQEKKVTKNLEITALSRISTRGGATTVAFSHIPKKCRTKNGIDRAKFYTIEQQVSVDDEIFYPFELIASLQEKRDEAIPWVYKEKNVGSKSFSSFLHKNTITKLICGHIHEAGPRAITTHEKTVSKNTPCTKLYCNNGQHSATLLTFHSASRISHEFLNLESPN